MTRTSLARLTASASRLVGGFLASTAWIASAAVAGASGATPETPTQALARLDLRLEGYPDDLAALTARAEEREAAGLPMGAFLDRRQILMLSPGDTVAARLAAYDLAEAGAPQAALAWLDQHPAAREGEAGAALVRRLEGDLAARRVRWGWAEPVFDPAERRHEAEAAIAALEAMRATDPADARAAGDLLLAFRLAERMTEAVALWEGTLRRDDAPFWLRLAAADAYLALRRPAEAEALYGSVASERPDSEEPWQGLYWATVEQGRYRDAAVALDELSRVPGQELAAEIQRGWLLLFEDRAAAGQARFEALFEEHPSDPRVRHGLATAHLWQGRPRRALRAVEELLARTTLSVPRVDNPSARISRAGALSALGDVAAARAEASNLVALYPGNEHARRLDRDLRTQAAPEVSLGGRYDTSDRGLGESWSQLEASVSLGTRARLSAGSWGSWSGDERYARGDVEQAYAAVAWRADRWVSVGAELDWDLSEVARDPGAAARVALFPDDRWRLDLGYALDTWRDLPLRARAADMVGDTMDAGVTYTAGTRWNARLGGGRSSFSDDNERTWHLAAAEVLARGGPVYRARFGTELYRSENSRGDVPYFSPPRDLSTSLTHRSEWVIAGAAGRRHTFSLFAYAGVYDQEGFDAGTVGGLWLQSDLELFGSTVLVLGAGARSQLYDGSRELDPRVFSTLRCRL